MDETHLERTVLPMSSLAYLVVALLSAAAAIAAWKLTPWITQRAASRPVGLDLEAEALVIASVWADPRRLPYLMDLEADDFAAGPHKRIWQAFLQSAGNQGVYKSQVGKQSDADRLGAELKAQTEPWRSQVQALLETADLNYMLSGLPSQTKDGVLLQEEAADKVVVASGGAVMGAAMDRNVLNGAALIVPSDTPDSVSADQPPVLRVSAHVTSTRKTVAAIAAVAWVAGLALLLPLTGYSGLPLLAAAASWLILGAGMGIVAMVDYDTMYIDMKAWAAGTAGAWVLAVAAAFLADDLGRLVSGAVMVAAVAVLFEVVNLGYKLVRGRYGQGFGDTLIIVATVGIPPALTGQWQLGYYSVMGALLAAIAGWIIAKVMGRAGRNIPFAFGPWLALGPLLALVMAPLNLLTF